MRASSSTTTIRSGRAIGGGVHRFLICNNRDSARLCGPFRAALTSCYNTGSNTFHRSAADEDASLSARRRRRCARNHRSASGPRRHAAAPRRAEPHRERERRGHQGPARDHLLHHQSKLALIEVVHGTARRTASVSEAEALEHVLARRRPPRRFRGRRVRHHAHVRA